MSAVSRKDYEAVASALRELGKDAKHYPGDAIHNRYCEAIADALKEFSPAFKVERFLAASGHSHYI
jgi:hypothetical protein